MSRKNVSPVPAVALGGPANHECMKLLGPKGQSSSSFCNGLYFRWFICQQTDTPQTTPTLRLLPTGTNLQNKSSAFLASQEHFWWNDGVENKQQIFLTFYAFPRHTRFSEKRDIRPGYTTEHVQILGVCPHQFLSTPVSIKGATFIIMEQRALCGNTVLVNFIRLKK